MKDYRITFRVSSEELHALQLAAEGLSIYTGTKYSANQFSRFFALESAGLMKKEMKKIANDIERKDQKYKGFSNDQLIEIQQLQRDSAVKIRNLSNSIGNNVNQIAKNLNTDSSYYSHDVTVIKQMLAKINHDQQDLKTIMERSFEGLWQ